MKLFINNYLIDTKKCQLLPAVINNEHSIINGEDKIEVARVTANYSDFNYRNDPILTLLKGNPTLLEDCEFYEGIVILMKEVTGNRLFLHVKEKYDNYHLDGIFLVQGEENIPKNMVVSFSEGNSGKVDNRCVDLKKLYQLAILQPEATFILISNFDEDEVEVEVDSLTFLANLTAITELPAGSPLRSDAPVGLARIAYLWAIGEMLE